MFVETQNVEAGLLLASTTYALNQNDEALDIMMAIYDHAPHDGRKDNLMGNLYLSKNKLDKAMQHYYSALEVDGANAHYGLNLAEAFFKAKQYKNSHIVQIKDESISSRSALTMKLRSRLLEEGQCFQCHAPTTLLLEDVVFHEGVEGTASRCEVCGNYFCANCYETHIQEMCFVEKK